MERYSIPRIIFINKLDRTGADPWQAIDSIRKKLGIRCAAVQMPIGQEKGLNGVIDLITQRAYMFQGEYGQIIEEMDIPESLQEIAKEKLLDLMEMLAELDPQIEDLYLSGNTGEPELIKKVIREQTIKLKFSPIFMGSAFKNKGVQQALDGVIDYLPQPEEKGNNGFIIKGGVEEPITYKPDAKEPFVGFAFKVTETKFGQLTFIRVYQGRLRRGEYVFNTANNKKLKVSRMIKMHAAEMKEITDIQSGDIFAVFGLECNTGDTLCDASQTFLTRCSSLHIPEPVIQLSIKPVKRADEKKLHTILLRFTREDPTLHVTVNEESDEIIVSGMGELHLQIYAERIRREFSLPVTLGTPTVNYRETITAKQPFNVLHKKQTGGAGQFARVIGYIQPLNPVGLQSVFQSQFVNKIQGMSIPNEYITGVEKGFYEALQKGPQTGYPLVNIQYVLEDGQTHPVDSSANAFAQAAKKSLRESTMIAEPQILEPIMTLNCSCENRFSSEILTALTRRRGSIVHTESRGDLFLVTADAPLSTMFGFATELRSITTGSAEFSLEYKGHAAVNEPTRLSLI